MSRNLGAMLGAAAILLSMGCVPLTEYKQLEHRYQAQEHYVDQHKGKLLELQRNEQVLTLRMREQERQNELLRTRLEKSETLRKRLQEKSKTLEASVPKPEAPPPSFLGLEINPKTQGAVLEQGILFASGKATLKRSGSSILNKVIKELNTTKYAKQQIRIDGHTDDRPITRSKSTNNWDLSAKRALAVLNYLQKNGITADRLSFAGYGPHKPFVDKKTHAARAKNRRVEIVLFEK